MKYTHEYRNRIMHHLSNNGVQCNFVMGEGKDCGLDFMICMEYQTHHMCIAIGDDKFAIMGEDIKAANYKIGEMPLRLYYGGEHLELVKRSLEFCAFNLLQMYEKENEFYLKAPTVEEIWTEIDDMLKDEVYFRRIQMLGKRKMGAYYTKRRQAKKQNSEKSISDL